MANSVDPNQMLCSVASDLGLHSLFTTIFNPFMHRVPLKGILANSADPDQMPYNAASDQSLYWLH